MSPKNKEENKYWDTFATTTEGGERKIKYEYKKEEEPVGVSIEKAESTADKKIEEVKEQAERGVKRVEEAGGNENQVSKAEQAGEELVNKGSVLKREIYNTININVENSGETTEKTAKGEKEKSKEKKGEEIPGQPDAEKPSETEKPEETKPEKPNKEIPFESGEKVIVHRSSGDVESDWKFSFIEPNSGKAVVIKMTEEGEILRKAVNVNELLDWQKTGKEKGKEKKESFEIKVVRAAEVLLGVDLMSMSKEERKRKYLEVEKQLRDPENGYSERAIEQAAKVALARENVRNEYGEIAKDAKGKKRKIRKAIEKKGGLESEKEHEKELKSLKQMILEDKHAYLEGKYGEGDERVLKNMKSEGLKLLNIMINEYKHKGDVMLDVRQAESAKNAVIIKKALRLYMKLGRGTRAAIGAALIGGSTALLAPTLPFIAAPASAGYFLYKMGRAGTGGTIAGGLQKLFGNRIVEAVYKRGRKKDYKKLKEQVSEKDRTQIEELIRSKKFEDISNMSYEYAKQFVDERLDKTRLPFGIKVDRRKFATGATVLATGFVGGVAGANLFDFLMGPNGLGVLTSGGGESNVLDKAQVREGEGVTHALRRQIMDDPERWGYKGDLSDTSALDKWAAIKARDVAVDNGYINAETGEEIRVLDTGPEGAEGNAAYVLDPSGNVHEYIHENLVKGGSEHVGSYEYEWKPEKGLPVEPKLEKEVPLADVRPEEQEFGTLADRFEAGEISPEERTIYNVIRNYEAATNLNAKEEIAKYLIEQSKEHPGYMEQYGDFSKAVGDAHSFMLEEEMGKKGFLFFGGGASPEKIADHFHGIVESAGFRGGKAHLLEIYLTDGQGISKDAIGEFFENGSWSNEKFLEELSSFKADAALGKIPEVSGWQPRYLEFGEETKLSLVRKVAENKFEYLLEDGTRGVNVSGSDLKNMMTTEG